MKQVAAERKPSTRRMRIGGRLLILLALPLAGLLAVTGFGVYTGADQSSAAAALKTRTEVAVSAFELADELQTQRALLVRNRTIPAESTARLEQAQQAITSKVSSLDASARRQAETTMLRVEGAAGVAHSGLGGGAAISSLSPAIDSVLDLATAAIEPGGAVDASWASIADNLARAQAASSEESDRLVLLDGVDSLEPTTFQTLVGLASAQRSLITLAATTAPYEMGVRINRVGHGVVAVDETRQAAFADLAAVDLGPWHSGVDSRTKELRKLHGEATSQAVGMVDNLAASSRRLLVLATAAAVVTLAITVLLLRRALKSIAKPLAALAAQAEDVAQIRLPEAVKAQQDSPDSLMELPPLRAEGAAEVHEVTEAFNDIQNTALRLAGEQAALRVNQAEALTNLGRRNQTLLVRQLDYITSLETEETDPHFLEHLFKLDHLASRMRRNAESLLILAGSETPRRRRSPAQVTEVVRAAMSEVEDFERVRIAHLVDSALAGPVVIDLIHLLAELVENALGFSPPDTTVEIDGGPLSQGGYQFAIIDHGVGMTDVELTAANHRLAGLDEFDGMPTRYLGQYVVAKLAAKIGVLVRLNPTNNGRGVSAIVTLPATAMFGAPDRTASTRPRPGSRAAREQGPEPFAPGSAVPHIEGDTSPEEQVVVPDLRDDAPQLDELLELRPEQPYDQAPDQVTVVVDADNAVGAVDTADVAGTPDFPDVPDVADFIADDQVGTELIEGTEAIEAAEGAGAIEDPHPDRWDRIVDSVLGDVVDLADLESATPPHNGVTPSEVADVFGTAGSDEPAGWWTGAGTASPVDEPNATPPVLRPPAFGPQFEAPFQEWRVEPGAPVVPSASVESGESVESAAQTEPTPTGPTPTGPTPTGPTQVEPEPAGPVPAAPRFDVSPAASSGEASSANGLGPSGQPGQPGQPGEPTSNAVGSGLLRRRVPGASLASRSSGFADAPAKPVERSADEVRSRLASFQAGRNRGRALPDAGGETAVVAQGETLTSSIEDVAGDPDASQDWRSGK